ncbi:PAS domain S-box protein [Methanothermobacter thermautotrophicus]|uniref:PAS domain S-box protein n=1 Tax=Methanothermobacter thermautotrophicus TaxID=145262 RepID=UPI0022B97819|nr:PAS domain S-box protein [Methanothermobacter thermautotrophicus]WBF08528.1 PAS domain S-box protein [Methanothermobacter thermautotrophicus]
MPSALVVEDEAVTSLELSRLLESWGYETVSVKTGEDAIETALRMKPDVILMDIVLPSDVDGVTAARAIKEKMDVPLIFITAYSSREVFERAAGVEPEAYLLKPFNSRELGYAMELAIYKNRIQNLLSHTSRRYQEILETTGEGVCVFNADGSIQYCNERMADLLSMRRDEIIGRKIFDFIHPSDRETMERILDSCRRGSSGEHELRFRTDEGTRWVILSGHPLIESSGFRGGFCMFRDITPQKMLERMLRRNNSCLRLLSRINRQAAISATPQELMEGVSGILMEVGYSGASFRESDGTVIAGEGEKRVSPLRPGIITWEDTSTAVIELEDCSKPLYLVVSAPRMIDDEELGFLREIASSTAGALRRMDSEQRMNDISSRYRELFENAGDAIFLVKDFRIIGCNSRALELFGGDEEDILGRKPWELSPEYQHHGESSEIARELIERAMNGEKCEFTWIHRKISGETFPTRVVLSRSGDIVMGIVRDMTELYRAHRKLKEEHRKFRDLLESIPDPTFALDTRGRVIAWNREIERLTGVKKEEILGRGDRAYAVPFYGRRTPGLLEFLLNPGKAPSRYRNISREGNAIYAEVHVEHMGRHFQLKASPIRDGEDRTVGAIEILRDVTDYIETKEKLRRSKNRYRAIFENRATPTAITDREWNITGTNRVFRELFGVDEGFNLRDLLDQDELQKLEKLRDSQRALIRMKGVRGNLHVMVHRGDLPDSDQMILSFNDITKLRESQRKLRDELRVRRVLSEIYPQAVSTDNLGEFTEYILDATCKLTGADGGIIRLRNGETITITEKLEPTEEVPDLEGLSEDGKMIRITSSSADMSSEFILRGSSFSKADLRAVRHISQYYMLAVNQISYRRRMNEHWNHLRLINIILKLADTEDPELFLEGVLDFIIRCPEFNGGSAYLDPDLKVERGLKPPDSIPDTEGVRVDGEIIEIPLSVDGALRGVLSLQAAYSDVKEKTEFLEVLGGEISDGLQRITMRNQLRESLREKEVLLREIHHRVKNNLQIVASLLSLQTAYTDNQETLNVLRDSQMRVRAMAVAHEKIYRSSSLSMINVGDYLRAIAEEMTTLQSTGGLLVDLNVHYDDIMSGMDRCIPLGLITNEIISNSIKHAFTGDRGRIVISLKREDDLGILEISDNGRGLPDDFNIDELESLGMQLVSNLVMQIGGELEYGNRDGAFFRITFPLE